MRLIYKISKKLHKWIGLLLAIFMIWMGISGIFLNHPGLISRISVPKWMVPEHYQLHNWNRSSLRSVVFSPDNPDVAYAYGRQGVWRTTDGGLSFAPYMGGEFPGSRYYRKTNTLLIIRKGAGENILAGCAGGLYSCNPAQGNWGKIVLPGSGRPVMKILAYKGRIYVYTDSKVFESDNDAGFKEVKISRIENEPRLTMTQLFFDLHDGEFLGLPGKLLFDLAGLIIVFLSISAIYIWVFPRKRKYEKKYRGIMYASGKRISAFRFFHIKHLKWGILSAFIILVMAGTGLFMRPPLIIALTGSIPSKYYPGFLPDNPWNHKIINVMYDRYSNRIMIDAEDGWWAGDAGLRKGFARQAPPVPVFAMGATVMEQEDNGDYIIGSFAGINRISRLTGEIADLYTGKPAGRINTMRPGPNMVTGYFRTPSGEMYVNTHYQGLQHLGKDGKRRFRMPAAMADNYRMPLWNYFFEIHNGRFFQSITGNFYILIVPLGSLLAIVLTLTGIFDWMFKKAVKIRNRKWKSPVQEALPETEETEVPV